MNLYVNQIIGFVLEEIEDSYERSGLARHMTLSWLTANEKLLYLHDYISENLTAYHYKRFENGDLGWQDFKIRNKRYLLIQEIIEEALNA